MTYTVPSTSHEYSMISWWAAQASGTPRIEMVDEESNHTAVWGLEVGAPPVKISIKANEKRVASIKASCSAQPPGVVGTSEAPARLNLLKLDVETSSKSKVPLTWDAIFKMAQTAYDAHFGTRNLKVYYTRKSYENVFWKLYGAIPPRPLSSVKYGSGVEQEILRDARRFLDSEPEYVRLGRPYKRVYCLHGPPGTGKTSLVTAIASELNRPLGIFNTDSLRDDTFINLLADRPPGCVLLFEDVDALFKDRDANSGGGMTFSTLLNALDGVLHPRGALIFLTTNHLDRLDAALQRPGRVDRLILVPSLSVDQATMLFGIYFPGSRDKPPAELLDKMVAKGISPAAFSQELFAYREAGPRQAIEALRKILQP
jgi:chaperone BCS1